MVKPLEQALYRERQAKDNVYVVLKRQYPVGADITWRLNGFHCGTVLNHGYGGRVKVLNTSTGNERWIYAYCVVE